jgi:hypothetical protein
MVFNLSNTVDIVANTLSVIDENRVIDVRELFLSKLDAIDNIVGLPPDTLNTLQKLGEAINNDSNFYESLIHDLSFKANAADTYTKTETYTEEEVNGLLTDMITYVTAQLALKASTSASYLKAETYTEEEVNQLFTDTSTHLTESLALKEPAFIAVSPLLKTTNSTTGNIELNLSSALTDVIDLKLDESQVQSMLDAYEPYTSESPISIFTPSGTGAMILKMDPTYSSNLLSKANANNVYTKTQADTRTQ